MMQYSKKKSENLIFDYFCSFLPKEYFSKKKLSHKITNTILFQKIIIMGHSQKKIK